LKAKKSFGQHFLHRSDIAADIAAGPTGHQGYKHLLEIGPGTGALTRHLLPLYPDLYVIEADNDMVAYQRKHFPQLGDRIIAKDFLHLDFKEIFGDEAFGIVGNFPYNISSQIVIRMIDNRHQVPELVGMFQKEMGLRIVSKSGNKDYGVLSIITQMYFEGEYLFDVDKSAFDPPPKVQSAVIRLKRRETPIYLGNEKWMRTVVKTCFQQRRKMLRNTVRQIIGDHEILSEPYFNQRPEQLTIEAWALLCDRLEAIKAEV
jgi:16S rRNA (adenine1518-N6/adenine1519-N6)-dimethyltransferase